MKPIKKFLLTGSVLAGGALVQQSALAGGIGLYEIASPDVGLASAGYAARAQDASTLYKNPAGMSLLDSSQVQGGLQLLYGSVNFTKDGSKTSSFLGNNDGGNGVGGLPGASFFYVQKITDKLAVGFGSFSYFGLAEHYNDNWVGRYYVQKATLLGMSLMPSASLKLTDWLSVGAGLNAMYGYLDDQTAVRTLAPGDGRMNLKDEAWGFGGNFGVILQPCEGTRFGVTYLSEVKLNFSAKPSFNNLGVFGNALLNNPPQISAGVTVPQSVMGGVYQELNKQWAVMADVGWQNWSRFGEVAVGVDSANPTSLTTQLHLNDTWHGAIGAQYKASEQWEFTGGFAYDSSAVDNANRSLILPVGQAYRYGLGALCHMSKALDLGAAYEFMWCGNMAVTQNSAYRGDVSGSFNNVWFSFFTLNLTYRF